MYSGHWYKYAPASL